MLTGRAAELLLATPLGRLQLATAVLTPLCVAAVLLAVFVDFVEFERHAPVRTGRRSVVATGTMLLFFAGLYAVIRLQAGRMPDLPAAAQWLLLAGGGLLMLAGAMVNVTARFTLGRNWSDHVKIYADHTLVTDGWYRHVRHPLYASLIWMSYGSALLYANWAAALLTTLVFMPAMYYRARQEEELLLREFPAYAGYRRRVRMFL